MACSVCFDLLAVLSASDTHAPIDLWELLLLLQMGAAPGLPPPLQLTVPTIMGGLGVW